VLSFAGAGLILAVTQPIVGNIVGGFAGNILGQYTSPAITALTGWGVGQLAGMFRFTHRFAQPLVVLGLSTAVIQIVQPWISGLLGGTKIAAHPATGMSGWPQGYSGWNNQRIGRFHPRYRGGRPMRGIGMVTGIPPTITAPPMPPAPAQPNGAPTGMQGLGMRPGVWAH
jgi:hypothetical protein